MKQIFTLSAATLIALSASAVTPKIYDNLQVLAISPDGKIMISELDGVLTVQNTETGDKKEFASENIDGYSVGQGRAFTNDGMFIGSIPSGDVAAPAYYKDGEWHTLNVPNPQFSSYAQGVTPDGSLIVGITGLAKMSIDDGPVPMQVPIIWERKSDGTYADGKILPYPSLDFTGRVPQYVTAITVSSDGKTVVGQVQESGGVMTSLITYSLGDNNEWSYDTSYDKMCNPNNLVFPEYPGEFSMSMPQKTDFMTAENKAAYEAALDAWYEEGTYDENTRPNPDNYMSDSEKAAYNAALAEYNSAYQTWSDKYYAFDAVYSECINSGHALEFNSVFLSGDEKSVISSVVISVEDPNSWLGFSNEYMPAVINTSDASYEIYPNKNVNISSLTEDNTLFGFTVDSQTMMRQAMVYLPNTKEPISLLEYYQTYLPETAQWIKDNMFHPMEIFDMETMEIVTLPDYPCTGTPFITPDGRVLATAVQNLFDDNSEAQIFTYLLPSTAAAVKNVADESDMKLAALKGGRILVDGNVSEITVYDLSGAVLFKSKADSKIIETGLNAGMYVVKATGNNVNKTIKAIFR